METFRGSWYTYSTIQLHESHMCLHTRTTISWESRSLDTAIDAPCLDVRCVYSILHIYRLPGPSANGPGCRPMPTPPIPPIPALALPRSPSPLSTTKIRFNTCNTALQALVHPSSPPPSPWGLVGDCVEVEEELRPIRDIAPGRKDCGVANPGRRIEWDDILSFRILYRQCCLPRLVSWYVTRNERWKEPYSIFPLPQSRPF